MQDRILGITGRLVKKPPTWIGLSGVACAAVTLAVVIPAQAAGSRPQPATASASVRIRLGPRGVPPYYLEYSGKGLEMRRTATGAVVATARAPKGFSFCCAAIAADYWTLAVEAYKFVRLPDGQLSERQQIFVGQFNPRTARVTLRRFAIPLSPANGPGVAGLALAPSGREVAIALNTKDTGEIRIDSLATGRIRVWRATGHFFNLPASMSWSTSGTLAFAKTGGNLTKNLGTWVLNTSTPGGNLLSDSRHVLRPATGQNGLVGLLGLLTTDGKKIVVPVTDITGLRGSESFGTSEIRVYSAATGKLLGVLLHYKGLKPVNRDVAWTNASGGVLIVNLSNREYKDGYGVLKGDHLSLLAGTKKLEFAPVF
jgi:hypothetical protein